MIRGTVIINNDKIISDNWLDILILRDHDLEGFVRNGGFGRLWSAWVGLERWVSNNWSGKTKTKWSGKEY
jgi:hypothetical protein